MTESPNIIQGENWIASPTVATALAPQPDTEPEKWQDRVAKKSTRGRAKKVDWDSSVLKYVKDIIKTLGWPNVTVCREVVATMRLLTNRYEQMDMVIQAWDDLPPKDQTRIFSLDKACLLAEVDRDEFASLVLMAIESHIKRSAMAHIDRNYERIIKATVDHAINGGAAGAKERLEMIKILERSQVDALRAKNGQGTAPASRKSRTPEPSQSASAPSLDSELAELESIESTGG